MIGDIENGKIGTVIVKDLSRLGREYLQTGYYTEIFFPQNDVRFIAINDNVDSESGDNEFAPFKNIINEWYAKDIGKKVRSAFKTRAMNGGICLGKAPYGYRKIEGMNNRLQPDENAPTVKKMFALVLEGKSCFQISKILESEHILTPKAYRMTKEGKTDSEKFPKYPYSWATQSVYEILVNPVYTGNMYCLRRMTKSFKDKRLIEKPQDEWIEIKDTHEALVSQFDFETVQRRLSVKQRDALLNPHNIFRGLVVCSNCGTRLSFQYRKSRKSKGCYRCERNIRLGTKECTSHYITLCQLETVVLHDIQRHVDLANENVDKYAAYLMEIANRDKTIECSAYKQDVKKAKKRLAELDTLLQKLYEDKVFGVITTERFLTMAQSMEDEQKELKIKVAEYADSISNYDKQTKGIDEFVKLISSYKNITEIDFELAHTLIDKIIVHDKVQTDDDVTMKIDIYYRFVGNISAETCNRIEVSSKARKNA